MKILVVTPYIPMPDRGSGELRFASLLRVLAERHDVTLYTWEVWGQELETPERERYLKQFSPDGIRMESGGLRKVLRSTRYDIVFFEWHYWVDWYIEDVYAWQPQAKIVIDTVDLVHRRLDIKAAVSAKAEDIEAAAKAKQMAWSAFDKADVVIAVSEEERALLAAERPDLRLAMIPNVHVAARELPSLTNDPMLVYVGNFRFDPNIDAVTYFCREIFPTIQKRRPDALLQIIGNAPPEDVLSLASAGVRVIGYVPDLHPYLQKSRISVAPLRYGAGMKGKVGEAMAYGLPVVTTSIGAQGLDLVDGHEALIGDSAETFAGAVLRLLDDRKLCDQIRQSGWRHMKKQFGPRRMTREVDAMLSLLSEPGISRSRPFRRHGRRLADWVEREILWRLRGQKTKNEERRKQDGYDTVS